jgi:hypothetical protein
MRNIMNPVQKEAMDWEANAIAQCKDDPELQKLDNWCMSCMMHHPCLCDKDDAVAEMRKYYEANRRTLFRNEPKLIGSWGRDMDGLMTELYSIATKRRWMNNALR